MIATNLVNGDDTKNAAIQHLEKQFDISTDQLRRVASLVEEQMKAGLDKCSIDCNIPMLPSWITRHPCGQEKGEYIGLDLSGRSRNQHSNELHLNHIMII
jgi:hexokinase